MSKEKKQPGRILRIRVGFSGNHSTDEFTKYSPDSARRVARRDSQEALKRSKKTTDPWKKLYYLLEARPRLGDKTSPYIKVDNAALQKDMKELEELVGRISQDIQTGSIPEKITPEKLLRIAEYLEGLPEKKAYARLLYKKAQKQRDQTNPTKKALKKKPKIGRL